MATPDAAPADPGTGEGRAARATEPLRPEHPYVELFEDAPCGYLETTPDGVITRVNRTFERWTGHARASLVGTEFVAVLAPSAQMFYETRYAVVLSVAGEVREVALTVRCADGRELPILVNAVVVAGADGLPRGIRTAVFDATDRQDYERQLLLSRRDAEASAARVRVLQAASSAFGLATSAHEVGEVLVARVGSALNATHAAVLTAGRAEPFELLAGDGLVVDLLPSGLETLVEQAVAGGEVVGVAHLDQAASILPGLDVALRARGIAALAIAPIRVDEDRQGVVVSLFADDQPLHAELHELQAALAGQAGQVLRRVRLQERLEHQAMHDQLTGLANRKLLQERLDAALASADRSGRPLSVVFLDLDGFKTINDRLGHRLGDLVLAEVAANLGSVARASDTVARYGGDEFVVVSEDADAAAGAVIAERFREELRRPLASVPPSYAVSASVGVAVWEPARGARPSADELLRIADEAMYVSKDAGRDRVTVVTLGEAAD